MLGRLCPWMAVQVVSKSQSWPRGVTCVHGTAKLSASAAGEAAPGLFRVSSPESIILTGSQGKGSFLGQQGSHGSAISPTPELALLPR